MTVLALVPTREEAANEVPPVNTDRRRGLKVHHTHTHILSLTSSLTHPLSHILSHTPSLTHTIITSNILTLSMLLLIYP